MKLRPFSFLTLTTLTLYLRCQARGLEPQNGKEANDDVVVNRAVQGVV
jgi:hypothetical protein